MKKNNIYSGGFTLLELLVAIGIMAVLTGMAIFNFNQSRVRARDIQRKNDLKQLQTALELYKNDNNSYPVELGFQTALMSASYTKSVFADPRTGEWVDYAYVPAVDLKTYYLGSCLENAADGTKATDTAVCNTKFMTDVNTCSCGPTTPKAGVMYIVTQP